MMRMGLHCWQLQLEVEARPEDDRKLHVLVTLQEVLVSLMANTIP